MLPEGHAQRNHVFATVWAFVPLRQQQFRQGEARGGEGEQIFSSAEVAGVQPAIVKAESGGDAAI